MTNDELSRISQLLDEKLKGLNGDIQSIKQTMATHEDLQGVKKELKKDIRAVRKDIRLVRTDIAIYAGQAERRFQRIEEHVGLPPLH